MIGGSACSLLAVVLGAWSSANGSRESEVAQLGCWIALGTVVLVVIAARMPKREPPGTGAAANSAVLQPSASAQKEPLQEAFDFAAFIGEGKCDPMTVYDVSVLPHPKERIEDEIMRVIVAAARAGQPGYAMRWHSMLDHLAQFQPEVGSEPVGIGPFFEQYRSEPRVPGNEVELARRYRAAYEALGALAGSVEADKTRYREFMHAALGEKWEREMAEVGRMTHELLDQLGVPREERQQLAHLDGATRRA